MMHAFNVSAQPKKTSAMYKKQLQKKRRWLFKIDPVNFIHHQNLEVDCKSADELRKDASTQSCMSDAVRHRGYRPRIRSVVAYLGSDTIRTWGHHGEKKK